MTNYTDNIGNLTEQQKQLISACMELAFLAGTWAGQVDLEEHYDRSQYADAFLEMLQSRKTAMPAYPASTGRTVTVNLRSDEWRNGVRKSANQHKENALHILLTNLELPQPTND